MRRRFLGILSISLVLFFLVFIAQNSLHTHANGQDDPTCGLCQVAHMGFVRIAAVALLNLVLLYFGEIAAPLSLNFSNPCFAQSPSRAPPALIA